MAGFSDCNVAAAGSPTQNSGSSGEVDSQDSRLVGLGGSSGARQFLLSASSTTPPVLMPFLGPRPSNIMNSEEQITVCALGLPGFPRLQSYIQTLR